MLCGAGSNSKRIMARHPVKCAKPNCQTHINPETSAFYYYSVTKT